jgi:hypothetical protein
MYNWKNGIAQWKVGSTLYISVPFTWLVADAERIAAEFKGKSLIGGPGLMRPTECPGFSPLAYHNPSATFTTRGCPNWCPFCAVHFLEPEFTEIPDYRPAPVLCDNNWTAASWKHQQRVVERQRIFTLTDFNQGLEAGKFTPRLADLLGTIRCKVRFAFDSWGQEAKVKDAIDLCRARATKDIGVYCLIGFHDSPEDARERLDLVRSWGIRPNPMRYQPLDTTTKNSHVDPGWTDYKLKKMMKYYSRLAFLEHVPYDDFKYNDEQKSQLELIPK